MKRNEVRTMISYTLLGTVIIWYSLTVLNNFDLHIHQF